MNKNINLFLEKVESDPELQEKIVAEASFRFYLTMDALAVQLYAS